MIRKLLRIERYPGTDVKLTMDGRACRYIRGKFTPDVTEVLFEEPSSRDGAPMLAMISMMGLYEELDWLRDHGALAGVMAIMRERRHQIEDKGWTPEMDVVNLREGSLCRMAERRLTQHKLFSKPGNLAVAGALTAAEIDRLEHGDKEDKPDA